ncbi:MAG: type II toxin-antitoxin system VapC family toxin [Gammaproteobacteria bacterium]|nr:type II toxin-antitoxin system VapC family toxin [Gammaproteobacteria bacterium]
MILMDVNVLVYAHREDVKDHSSYQNWLESVINGNSKFGYSELVLSGFIRIVTHPKIFELPSTLDQSLTFVNQVRSSKQAVCLAPSSKHWSIFQQCLELAKATGNAVPDAYHAALAMEWDCQWVTTDKGFKRFKGLKTKHPLK